MIAQGMQAMMAQYQQQGGSANQQWGPMLQQSYAPQQRGGANAATGYGLCDKCGKHHWGDPEDCHAYLLMQGKPVPGWEEKSSFSQDLLRSTAQMMKDHGLAKDRPGWGERRDGLTTASMPP